MRENCAMKLETFCVAQSLISVWVLLGSNARTRTRTQTLAEHPFGKGSVARCTLIAPHRPRAQDLLCLLLLLLQPFAVVS